MKMVVRACLQGLVLLLLLPLASAADETAVALDLQPTEPAAQFELGVRYLEGDGVRRAPREGLRWLKRASKAGYRPAQNHLAICYRTGTGVLFKARRKAERLFLEAAEAGYLPAVFNYANCFLEDDAQNGFERARPWLEQAAAVDLEGVAEDDIDLFSQIKGEANALLGHHILDPDHPEELERGRTYFQTAADLGSLDGQLNTARCFALGLGTEPDLETAARYLDNAGHNLASRIRRVSDVYFTSAQISAQEAYALEEEALLRSRELQRDMRVRIANELADSDTVDRDPERAFTWFSEAAQAGSEYAAARAGVLWMGGIGHDAVDEAQALAFLRQGAEVENPSALHALGYYWSEVASPPDPVKARQWYEQARTEGFYAAHLALQGDRSIRPMTLLESMELARRDAPAGGLEALFATGLAAWYGIGEEQDQRLGAERFLAAANGGHPEAAFYAGMAYLSGKLRSFKLFDDRAGEKKAFAQLQAGAQAGSDDALYMLGLFNLYGISLGRPDPNEAERCFQDLWDKGDVKRGANAVALVYLTQDSPRFDPFRAIAPLTIAADAGNLDSIVRLAALYSEGAQGVDKNLEEMRRWAERAIAQDKDDPRGHFFLGKWYETSANPDLALAYKEYELAAIKDHVPALIKVANAYATGETVPYNPRIAARFYRSLLNQGKTAYLDDLLLMVHAAGDESELRDLVKQVEHSSLRSEKANLYHDLFRYADATRKEDRSTALAGILRAAKRGDVEAQVFLLERFSHTSRPDAKVLRIAKLVTVESNPDGYFFLAQCLRRSDSWKVKGDPDTMERDAAEAGSILAIEHLNQLRLEAAPAAPTREQIKAWLQPKVDKGYEDAIELLETILEEESGDEPTSDPAPDRASGLGDALA